MQATYDEEADALSVTLVPEAARKRTARIAGGILLHFDAADHLIEIEVLGASGHYPKTVLERLESPAELLTIAEASKESGLAPDTLRKQAQKGKLKATQKGRDWIVTRADLYTYLENRAPSGRPARRKKGRRAKLKSLPTNPTPEELAFSKYNEGMFKRNPPTRPQIVIDVKEPAAKSPGRKATRG